ncbi:homocysteine S-methyltransferase [Lepeophtheirus salmonis]|uniref:Homocysteine S-methyltransferase 4 n=1 Tax=Lepeophtheirus salmonis TaxID=72036 RepID=D3PJG0_LEPSM|nr:homocysteine S-methyltransferase-like [Lepeophtheirus salmonis]ADD38696.1 Homocysteine S-methyltransferase 4 [Lepeophtheirus salmonis]
MTDIFYPIFPRVLGKRDEFFVLDGGFSTQCVSHVSAESFTGRAHWTSELIDENPEAVVETHKDFLSHGSVDLISTNTYQAHCGTIEKAVELADQAIFETHAIPRKAGIVGSLGPYAAFLASGSEYNGDKSTSYPLSEEELKTWHKERIRHMMIGGVDVIAFETIPSIKEAILILDLIDNTLNAKCWISFQCKDSKSLAYGDSYKEAVRSLMCHPAYAKRKLLSIGINCTSPKYISPLLKLAEEVNNKSNFPDMYGYWRIPYVVYPNRGVYCKKKTCYIEDKDDILGGGDNAILKRIHEWMSLGARIIGGCCGVNAQLIQKIKDQISEHILDVLDKEEDCQCHYFVDDEVLENSLRKADPKSKSERRNKTNDFTDNLWMICEMPYKNTGWSND